MPGQLANAEVPPGRPQPPHSDRASAEPIPNHAAASQNPVPAFMTALLPQVSGALPLTFTVGLGLRSTLQACIIL